MAQTQTVSLIDPFDPTQVADKSARANRNQKYADSELGKAARARAQAKRKAKRQAQAKPKAPKAEVTRKELAKVKRAHEQRRRAFSAATFSKLYTVYTTRGIKQTGPAEDELIGAPPSKGVGVFKIARYYPPVGLTTPQCVQGGVPRWSESIKNPAYRKKLLKALGLHEVKSSTTTK